VAGEVRRTRLGIWIVCAALLSGGCAGAAGAVSNGAAATRATCATTRPTTFLVDPAEAEAGGTTRLLLWCREPARLGFEGSFGPTAVLIYTRAGFGRLREVNGRLRPAGGGSGVRPLAPKYAVLGPDDAWIALPDSMRRGAYVVLVDDGRGDVRAENLLEVG
jgi:hypothetical protein